MAVECTSPRLPYSRERLTSVPRPFLCAVITEPTPESAIHAIRTAEFDGARAYLLDLLQLRRQFHTLQDLRRIICSTHKPVMVYYYRRPGAQWDQVSDDVRADAFKLSVEAGAAAVDMMADFFDPSPLELSHNADAIARQKDFICLVHDLGGEVLISSHTMVPMSTDEVLGHVRHMLERQPDLVKIVPRVPTERSLLEAFATTVALRHELDRPFIHIAMGEYNAIHRIVGPLLGSAACFCVPYYNEGSTIEQPLLRSTRLVFDNLVWVPMITNDSLLGNDL